MTSGSLNPPSPNLRPQRFQSWKLTVTFFWQRDEISHWYFLFWIVFSGKMPHLVPNRSSPSLFSLTHRSSHNLNHKGVQNDKKKDTTRTQGHKDTRTQGHKDTRTQGHKDTRTQGHRTQEHKDKDTQGHTDTQGHKETRTLRTQGHTYHNVNFLRLRQSVRHPIQKYN